MTTNLEKFIQRRKRRSSHSPWRFSFDKAEARKFSRFHCCGRHGGSRTLRPQDTSASPRQFGTTKLVPKFKTNHRWSCVSSELSWVEVSRLFLDHGTRVEVSSTTFLVSKCLETGAEVHAPECLDAEVSGNLLVTVVAVMVQVRCWLVHG